MARFLFATWPASSHLHPYLAISEALRRRGHDVAHYNGERCRSTVERAGLTFFPFRSLDQNILDRAFLTANRSLSRTRPMSFMENLIRFMIDPIPAQVDDLEPILDEWNPDVIVSDVVFLAPPLILSEKRGLSVAMVPCAAGCMIPGPEAPVWGFGIPPPTNWAARVRTLALQGMISMAAARFRSRTDQIRKQYGLRPLTKPVHAFLGDMPLYLTRGTPEFDYARKDLPPSVRYVGALLWSTGRGAQPTPWLKELRRDQPVIHVTEGTMQNEPVLLKAAAAGLGGLAMQVIMTTGGNRDPKQLGLDGVAPNIRIESWVPHEELLPISDVVVTVGGAGTVLASLSAGAPVVVVPSESDQLDSARRAADSGAGICLPRRKCTARKLRAAIEEVLGNPSYKENARRMSAELARYRGGERAAELLEELAGRRPMTSAAKAG